MALTETYHGRKPEAALPYLLGSVGRSAELEDQTDDGQGGPNTGPEGSSIGLQGKTSKLPYKIALAFEKCRARVSPLIHSQHPLTTLRQTKPRKFLSCLSFSSRGGGAEIRTLWQGPSAW